MIIAERLSKQVVRLHKVYTFQSVSSSTIFHFVPICSKQRLHGSRKDEEKQMRIKRYAVHKVYGVVVSSKVAADAVGAVDAEAAGGLLYIHDGAFTKWVNGCS